MRRTHRYRHRKCRPPAKLTLHFNGPTMQPNQFPHHRQPNTRTLHAPGPAALYPMEPVEYFIKLIRRNTTTRIRNSNPDLSPVRVNPNADLPLRTILERIAHQVQHDPLPKLRIHIHGIADHPRMRMQGHTRPLDRRTKTARQIQRHHGDVYPLKPPLQPPRLQPREFQQCIHQLLHPQGIAISHAKAIAVHLHRSRIVQEIGYRSQQKRQRRAKFMTNIREKQCLGPVDLRQRFGPASLHLKTVDIGKTGRQLIGHQRTKIQVTLIGRPVRIQPHHQEARCLLRTRLKDR